MDAAARVTSKGQVTVPQAVRDALGIEPGDTIVFRVDGERAVVAKTRSLLDLAGSVPVPAAVKGTPWPEVRRLAWERRGRQIVDGDR